MNTFRLRFNLIALAGLGIFLNACGFMQLLPVRRFDTEKVMAISPQDKFVHIDTDVPHVKIHYRDYGGEGKNVVLIHGFASSAYTWEDMVPELQKKYPPGQVPHIWALDMKGFGWSDKPLRAKYDALTLSDEVAAWMDKVGIDRAAVVGNSLGGAVAVALALDYPEKVERLTLIDPGGYVVRAESKSFAITPFTSFTTQLFFSPPFIKMALESAFYDRCKVTDEKVEQYFKRLNTPGCLEAQKSFIDSVNLETAKTYTGRLGSVEQKTLIIWGRDDAWIPLGYGCCFKNALPNAVMRIILQSGHVPQEEQPARTAALLHDFLQGVPLASETCTCHEQ